MPNGSRNVSSLTPLYIRFNMVMILQVYVVEDKHTAGGLKMENENGRIGRVRKHAGKVPQPSEEARIVFVVGPPRGGTVEQTPTRKSWWQPRLSSARQSVFGPRRIVREQLGLSCSSAERWDAVWEHTDVEGGVGAKVLVKTHQVKLAGACLGLKVEEWSGEALSRFPFSPP